MSSQVNIHEAKTHLSRLLEEVSTGKEIIIARAGKPVARLIPYKESRQPRVLGRLSGSHHESEDCWDPDEDLEASIDAPLVYQSRLSETSSRIADEPSGS